MQPRFFARWWLAAILFAAGGARAHEFWMLPDAFQVAPGGSVALSLAVGQDFIGEPVPFSRPLVADLRHLAGGRNIDLRLLAGARDSAMALRLPLPTPGTHVIALASHPSFIELPAPQFNDYLRLEGLTRVLQARERAGTSDRPGREAYRRDVKTLVQVGPTVDATLYARAGQRLEIVPLPSPGGVGAQQPLTLQVWFDGRPLEGALLKLWHDPGPGARVQQAVTDAQGRVTLTPDQDGTWMASVVHMVPAPDARDRDWDSYWGNLTFALPLAGAAQSAAVSTAPRR